VRPPTSAAGVRLPPTTQFRLRVAAAPSSSSLRPRQLRAPLERQFLPPTRFLPCVEPLGWKPECRRSIVVA
ncbi:hypothetical protein VIGAN_02070500, partial [Vigna angularis var. angularis]